MAAAEIDEVINQSPPYADVNLYDSDRPLQEAVAANGAGADQPALRQFGRAWGAAEMFEQARLANEDPPKLRTFDDKGRRLDIVEFHPAYHRFMAQSIGEGLHASTWTEASGVAPAPAEVVRAARYYMVAQVENGHMCPVTMTRASVAALSAEASVAAPLLPKIISRTYDPRFLPWPQKSGITVGMGMTEKQGGTDVRANLTRADRDSDAYRINGHKWFMSAPMCDAFLVLAQATAGLTCFLMPRFRPDGHVNGLRFQRLKDKLGNRSNASSEVEFKDAYALRVGDEGAGVRTILSMVQFTRLDCAISSAGMMRACLARALHHCRHRNVFGRPLAEQPMMRTVLADMALEVEGAVAAVMRLCRAFDHAAGDTVEAARTRLLTPVLKFAICKTAPGFAYEAMECLGGNGYVEEEAMARLYREAPVNAIWEGSGNVVALDVLRALSRDATVMHELLAQLANEARGLPGAAEAAAAIATDLKRDAEAHARTAVERIAALAAVAALNVSAPAVAEVFARTRLGGRRGSSYGSAAIDSAEMQTLLGRALPEL